MSYFPHDRRDEKRKCKYNIILLSCGERRAGEEEEEEEEAGISVT